MASISTFHRPSFHSALFALLFTVATVLALSGARAADTPEGFVKSLSDRASAILDDKSLSAQARFDSFRELILANADLDKIADFALGRYGQQMRDADKYDEYKSLFRDYVVRIYASRLSSGSEQTLRVLKSLPKGPDEVIVSSVVDPAPGSPADPVDVNWRLIKVGDSYKIKDVQIAGAWMAIEQQSQFQSIISNNNRNPAMLINYLQQQLKQPVPGTQGAQGKARRT